MRLQVQVAEAAYTDKRSSDVIMLELFPSCVMDPQDEAGSSVECSSWPRGPCVRDSAVLEALHMQLRRRHPHMLLPRFPLVNRHTSGWGSDAFLQLMRRRMERYFARLLGRSEIQNDSILQDFLVGQGQRAAVAQMAEADRSKETKRQGSVLKALWPPNWFGGENTSASARGFCSSLNGSQEMVLDTKIPDDRILEYMPVHMVVDELLMRTQEGMARSVALREHALKEVFSSMKSTLSSLQDYSTKLRLLGESLNGVTSAHVRHLVSNLEDARSTQSSLMNPQSLQDEQRSQERRFREVGDQFVDVVNQLQPGWDRLGRMGKTTVLEVTAGQIEEMAQVKQYINSQVDTLLRYDLQVGRRQAIQATHDAIEVKEGLHPSRRSGLASTRASSQMQALAETKAALEQAVDVETILRERLEEKTAYLRDEMEVFWRQTSDELFQAMLQLMKGTIEISQGHIDCIRPWLSTGLGRDSIP